MKHTKRTKVRTLWLIAVITTIGFVLTGCKEPEGNTTTNPCAKGHEFPEWTAPTCTEEGNSERTCTRCSVLDTRTDGFASLGHDMKLVDGGNVIEAPTCTENGIGETACAREDCGHTEEDGVIDALGHDMREDWAVFEAASCEEDGETERFCHRECGHREELPLEKLGHDMREDWAVLNTPTCEEDGDEERFCHRNCGRREELPLPKLGHHHVATGVVHTAATCTVPGSEQMMCDNLNGECGDIIEGAVINALTHLWIDNWVITKQPNCTANGDRYRVCDRLDDCEERQTQTDTINVHALGHDWKYNEGATVQTCTQAGSGARHCLRDDCDETSTGGIYPPLGHLWIDNWVITKDPTCEDNGDRYRICDRFDNCEEMQTENNTVNVPPIGHEWLTENWVITKHPTCLANGDRERECNRAGCVEIQEQKNTTNLSAYGSHRYPPTTPATCTTDSVPHNCDRPLQHVSTGNYICGIGNPQEVVKAFTHIFTTTFETCTTASIPHPCSRWVNGATCNTANPEQVRGNLGGHSYPATVPATCTAANIRYPCNRTLPGTGAACNNPSPEAFVAALQHNWGAWSLDDPDIKALTGIGLSRTCSKQTESSCNGTVSVSLAQYISSYATQAGTAAAPVPLKISIDLGDMGTNSDWRRATTGLLAMLSTGNRFVTLDLSGSTRSSNGEFTTGSTANSFAPGLAGLNRIVSLIMPNATVTSIPTDAFRNCTNLTSVTIGNSVTSISNSAFRNCTNLTSVTIGNSVTSIGSWAFFGCTGLTSITIPNSVTSISTEAFQDCIGLTSVAIGSGLNSFNTNWFSGCTNLASITVDADNPNFTVQGGIVYNKAVTSMIYVPRVISGSVTIPNGVTNISGFSGRTGLTSIVIPDSVTSLPFGAFEGCTGLTGITIPNSVTSIGMRAFDGCTGLTSIVIPNSVTSIDDQAFRNCSGLTSIHIGSGVTTIGSSVFAGCTNLASITVDPANTNFSANNNVLFSATAIVFVASGANLTGSVTIPDGITSIGWMAFSGRTGLTSVTIPDSVTSIDSSAFSGCTGLTSVTIPDSVTNIGVGAFQNCTGLTSITIPNSVTSIGNSVFQGCTGLTSVTIPNSVTSIGESAFRDCTGLTSITIPDSVTSIGNNVFSGCTGLTSITIPASVTSIGQQAFQGCTSLTLVTLERWMPELEGTARISTAGTTPFGSTSGQWNTALRIVVPAGSVAVYKAAANWSLTTGAAVRNRIHAAGCSNTSVTANCTQCN